MMPLFISRIISFKAATTIIQRTIFIVVYILFLSFTASLYGIEEKQETRTWTSCKGEKIQATFINIQNNNVTLKDTNGKFIKIRLGNFSTADQVAIKKIIPTPTSPSKDDMPTGAITPSSPTHLATFSDGKWEKYNTIFTSPKYDAAMDKDMNITLYLKDNDNPLGNTVFLRWGVIFLEGVARKSIWCKTSELKTKPEPEIIKRTTTIELSAKLDNNIDLELTYIFSTKGISITGRIKEPKSRQNPSKLIYAVEFKPIKSIKDEMSGQEIKSTLAGYSLLTTNRDGKKKKLLFWESLQPGPVREVTTIGPWGARKVIVKTPMEKKKKTRQSTCGIISIYSGKPPYGGYRITRTASTDSKIETQISIE